MDNSKISGKEVPLSQFLGGLLIFAGNLALGFFLILGWGGVSSAETGNVHWEMILLGAYALLFLVIASSRPEIKTWDFLLVKNLEVGLTCLLGFALATLGFLLMPGAISVWVVGLFLGGIGLCVFEYLCLALLLHEQTAQAIDLNSNL